MIINKRNREREKEESKLLYPPKKNVIDIRSRVIL